MKKCHFEELFTFKDIKIQGVKIFKKKNYIKFISIKIPSRSYDINVKTLILIMFYKKNLKTVLLPLLQSH